MYAIIIKTGDMLRNGSDYIFPCSCNHYMVIGQEKEKRRLWLVLHFVGDKNEAIFEQYG